MATNTIKVRHISANNTATGWASVTSVPLKGELCLETDTGKAKIGNGTTPYSELPYAFVDTNFVYALIAGSETTAVDKVTVNVKMASTGGSPSTSSIDIGAASTTRAGVMTKAQATKLGGIYEGANKVEVAEGTTNGSIKVTTNGTAATVNVHGLNNAAYTSSATYVTNVSTAAVSGKAFKIQQTKGGTASDVTPAFGTASTVNTTTVVNSSAVDTLVPTEKAVKTYVDGLVANATHFMGGFTASGDGAISGSTSETLKTRAEKIGDMYVVTTAGTFCGIAFEIGDSIIFQKAVAAGTAVAATDFIAVESTVSVSNNGPTLSWGNTSTVGTVEGTALTVTMPSNPNTDTKVTAVGNHYTPSSSGTFSASATGATAAWGIDVVKGVTLNKDAAGHITGISVDSGKIPANPNTNYYTTAMSGSTAADGYTVGVSGNNTAVKGSVKIPTMVGATSGAPSVPGLVPQATTAQRGMFLKADGTWATPSDTNTNYYTTALNQTTAVDKLTLSVKGNNSAVKGTVEILGASASAAGVMTTAHVDQLSKVVSATTAVEGITKKPSGTAPISVDANNVISLNNSGVSAGTYGSTSAQTPGYNTTFTVPYVTVDAKGRVTAAGNQTVKIPAADNTNYYTTASNRSTAATSFTVNFNRTDGTNKYSFTIPEATETMAGVSSTVSTDRLRNGVNTLILDGNFTTA